MQFVKLLSVLICVLSVCTIAAAQSCPSTGISCYPSDCCSSFRQCNGGTFYAVQATAGGTVCKAGNIVHASECTTPCSPPASGTTKPISVATPAPTQRPATAAPTQQPATAAPTQRPATAAPTQQPATAAPTQRPATAAPTQQPATAAPTSKPATPAPTQRPATAAPTQQPATAAPTQQPVGGCTLSQVLSQSDYNALFPHLNGGALSGAANQHAIFNYSYLLDAAKTHYPLFGCVGDFATRQKEVIAFLAQTSQETSGWWAGQPYNWGYYFSTEVGCTAKTCTGYCDPSNTQYPCAPNQGYFGRGPIQLSWNYNYGQMSQYLFKDNSLLTNPDKIFESGSTAFATALWFWMTPQYPKPSAHDVMTGGYVPTASDLAANRVPGFGLVTHIVNGGIECGSGSDSPQSLNRQGYFNAYLAHFGYPVAPNESCKNMRSFY